MNIQTFNERVVMAVRLETKRLLGVLGERIRRHPVYSQWGSQSPRNRDGYSQSGVEGRGPVPVTDC